MAMAMALLSVPTVPFLEKGAAEDKLFEALSGSCYF